MCRLTDQNKQEEGHSELLDLPDCHDITNIVKCLIQCSINQITKIERCRSLVEGKRDRLSFLYFLLFVGIFISLTPAQHLPQARNPLLFRRFVCQSLHHYGYHKFIHCEVLLDFLSTSWWPAAKLLQTRIPSANTKAGDRDAYSTSIRISAFDGKIMGRKLIESGLIGTIVND